VPHLVLAEPEATDEGWTLQAWTRGKALWAWSFDLDGDGVFETEREADSREAARATVAGRAAGEARVRVRHEGSPVLREGVWRLRSRD
jgi:hypothetical protein